MSTASRVLTMVLVILAQLTAFLAPVFVDAHHWWPRRGERRVPQL